MYKFTESLTSQLNFITSENGCPNLYGLLLHTFVFFLLTCILMAIIYNKNKDKDNDTDN
jgi:hypothetical protein